MIEYTHGIASIPLLIAAEKRSGADLLQIFERKQKTDRLYISAFHPPQIPLSVSKMEHARCEPCHPERSVIFRNERSYEVEGPAVRLRRHRRRQDSPTPVWVGHSCPTPLTLRTRPYPTTLSSRAQSRNLVFRPRHHHRHQGPPNPCGSDTPVRCL